MKKLSYQTPDRKIGEVFLYNGKRYQVMDAANENLVSSIGCTIRDEKTGNFKNLCAFASFCGRVNRVHRGYCTPDLRSDKKIVYFKEI